MPRNSTAPATLVARKCAHCGKGFVIAERHIKRGRGTYCNQSCQRAGSRKQVEVVCEECGNKYRDFPSHLAKTTKRYCSRACHDRARGYGTNTHTLTCQHCGVAFNANNYSVAQGKKRFCSKACVAAACSGPNSPSWKGGASPRTFNKAYIEWRAAVFTRDNFTCQQCRQRGGDMHAHHIRGWAKFPACRYDRANGVTLCVSCHRELHSRRSRGLQLALSLG